MDIFIQGMTIGLAYLAPIGMQNIFIINTACTKSKKDTYITALCIIFFDIALGLTCFFGIGVMMEAYPILKKIILLFGGILVIWIGISLLKAKVSLSSDLPTATSIKKMFSTSFLVTWCNPQAIIDGTMMLGAFKASLPTGTDFLFVGGFSSASALWFLGISTVLSFFHKKIGYKALKAINLICGIVIIAYGLKLLWHFFL